MMKQIAVPSLFPPNVEDLFHRVVGCRADSFKKRGLVKWYSEMKLRTQMDENYTNDVNFASIINKFQVYDIAHKSFPCLYFPALANMLLRLFIYVNGMKIYHGKWCTFAAINDKLLSRCFASLPSVT